MPNDKRERATTAILTQTVDLGSPPPARQQGEQATSAATQRSRPPQQTVQTLEVAQTQRSRAPQQTVQAPEVAQTPAAARPKAGQPLGQQRGAAERRSEPTPAPKRAVPLSGLDGKPWYESYFGPDYPLLYPDKDRESGEREVQSILAALALRPGARVLDVGCGRGRHALALARRGFRVTGIERSADQIAAAAVARDAEGLELELRHGDMRQLAHEVGESFEAVLSLFTSFGYFNEAENEEVARGFAASLASGGRLLLDLNNRELVEEANGMRTWATRPGGYLLDAYGFDPDLRRFHGTRTLLIDGRERSYVFDHRVYSEAEIRSLLKRAGLRVLAVYGTLERTPFNLRAPRLVVLAEKP